MVAMSLIMLNQIGLKRRFQTHLECCLHAKCCCCTRFITMIRNGTARRERRRREATEDGEKRENAHMMHDGGCTTKTTQHYIRRHIRTVYTVSLRHRSKRDRGGPLSGKYFSYVIHGTVSCRPPFSSINQNKRSAKPVKTSCN